MFKLLAARRACQPRKVGRFTWIIWIFLSLKIEAIQGKKAMAKYPLWGIKMLGNLIIFIPLTLGGERILEVRTSI
jgi:hypothetical protein